MSIATIETRHHAIESKDMTNPVISDNKPKKVTFIKGEKS